MYSKEISCIFHWNQVDRNLTLTTYLSVYTVVYCLPLLYTRS
jgi:hypothetical protein